MGEAAAVRGGGAGGVGGGVRPPLLGSPPSPSAVMPVLVTGIHAFPCRAKAWMAGTSPAMTNEKLLRGRD